MSGIGGATFSERIAVRQERWWTGPEVSRDPHAWLDYHRRIRATDSEERWRCCGRWPRKLLNKWNARELAIRSDVPVPALYRRARWAWQLRPSHLPSAYVIRPFLGAGDRGVAVIAGDRELIDDRPADRRRVPPRFADQVRPLGRPYLVEEFVARSDGRPGLPIEYKCHTFAGAVVAVQVEERVSRNPRLTHRRYYDPDWGEFPGLMDTADPLGPPRPRPHFLDALIAAGERMGGAIGTYMRIDFLDGPNGPVFNEFSSTPSIGTSLTRLCDDLFGRAWAEYCPDMV